MDLWRRSAREQMGDDYAHGYAARFDALAAEGADVHGEAAFVARLLPPGGSVLDAGCGTGRVGARLHELGFQVTGVDVDVSMVAVARERFPGPTWLVADLAGLDLGATYDVVVMAGNVVPFVESGLDRVAASMAAHVRPGGHLVCGYGLDAEHLPEGALQVPFADWDAACTAAGLHLVGHHAGWDAAPYDGGGYSVSVHVAGDDGATAAPA